MIRNPFVVLAISATLLVSCITDPDDNQDNRNSNTLLFAEGRTLAYSIYEINYVDSTSTSDSSIGVMVIEVGAVDSIRQTPVHRWTVKTEFYTGNSHPTDSVFTSYDYVEETDSFLLSRAYPTKHESNSGILMKRKAIMERMLCEQTDSVSANGDSVQIENVDVKTFCKKPSVGMKWTMRPDWLEYEIVEEDVIVVGTQNTTCFRIEATPLDSHCTVTNESTYHQSSCVTSEEIVRTVVSHPLPDSIWHIPNYTRIELIEEVENEQGTVLPNAFKTKAMERGWD